MDDLFIQEEVIVKTEPVNNGPHFGDNLSEKFFIDGPHNDDLMAYLNHSDSKDKNFIKKEPFGPEDHQNIFETGNHFMDPDTLIAHYEEVVQDMNSSVSTDDLLLNVKEPLKKEIKQRKSAKKKKGGKSTQLRSSPMKTRLTSKAIIKTEEEEEEQPQNFSFECSLCMFTTGNETHLKQHMLDHIGGPDTDTFVEESHNGEAYTCLFCPFISVSADLFKDHIKFKHSGQSKSTRSRSRRNTSQVESDDNDFKINTLGSSGIATDESLPCKFCSITTQNKEQLHDHLSEAHSDKLLECSHCDFFTIYKSTLKRHEYRHNQSKIYKCNFCNFSTHNIPVFHKHQISHSEVKPYPCDECHFRAKSRDSLRQHKKLHSGDMPFMCSFCPYKAGKKSRIIRHERIHTGERPYACPHCSFRCNQGSTLKIHVRRHTGEKPYECTLCTFRAVSKCSLNSHLKKHSSSKGGDFVCQVCDQIYNNFTALKKHEKTHDDEPLEGYLKQVTNKKRKADRLAEAALSSMPSTHTLTSKGTRKRQKRESKKKEKKTENTEDIASPIARLYRCTICPYRCSKFVELSDHMTSHHKSHSDDLSAPALPKKYRCTPCNVFFSKKREMKIHMKEKHEIKKEKEVTIKIGDYVLSVRDE